jgi:hypothetical protein
VNTCPRGGDPQVCVPWEPQDHAATPASDGHRDAATSAQSCEQLRAENERLKGLLAGAEDTLRAIRAGEVDAVVVESGSPQVYTLDTAHKPYRLLVEQMPHGLAPIP